MMKQAKGRQMHDMLRYSSVYYKLMIMLRSLSGNEVTVIRREQKWVET